MSVVTLPFATSAHRTEEEWLQARRQGVGASEASAVLGENPYRSALDVFCQKTGIAEATDLSDIEAVEWGRKLEPLVAEKFSAETGLELLDLGRYTICHNTDYPAAYATLDRVIVPRCDDLRQGVLEIKTTHGMHAEEWEESVPRMPWIQVQHQLAVTGLTWGALAVLIGGQRFRWMRVERDQAFIDAMMTEIAEFWQRVQSNDPPSPDRNSKAAIAAMYPDDDGNTVPLDGDATAWDERLQELKAQIKECDAQKAQIENNLRAAIGDASFGLLPNGVRYSHKLQHRDEHVVKASSFRVLRRLKK